MEVGARSPVSRLGSLRIDSRQGQDYATASTGASAMLVAIAHGPAGAQFADGEDKMPANPSGGGLVIRLDFEGTH